MAPTLSAFLPLRISGEKCMDDLRRSSLLLRSLEKHWQGERPLELVVCVREDERSAVEAGIKGYRNLDLRVILEGDLVPELLESEGASGWYRQMLLKLAFSKAAESDLYLTLDADVVCVRPISDEILVRGGRAVTQWESKHDHPGWWRDSSRLLLCDLHIETPGSDAERPLDGDRSGRAGGDRADLGRELRARPPPLQRSEGLHVDGVQAVLPVRRACRPAAGVLLLDPEQQTADLSLHVGFNLWTADGETFARWDPASELTESGRGFFLVCQSNIGAVAAPFDEIERKLLPLLT